MLMFGPRINQVFASRWKALFWAISVMISAYFMVPGQEETANSKASGADAQAAASMMAAVPPAQAQGDAASPSPWSK